MRSMYLLGLGMATMLANLHMCGIMLLLHAVLNMLVRNASLIGPMCFSCLKFSLSGPCELLNDRERRNIFGHWISGSCESSMSILGWILAWYGSGLNNVTEDFGEEIYKELSSRYAVISSR